MTKDNYQKVNLFNKKKKKKFFLNISKTKCLTAEKCFDFVRRWAIFERKETKTKSEHLRAINRVWIYFARGPEQK